MGAEGRADIRPKLSFANAPPPPPISAKALPYGSSGWRGLRRALRQRLAVPAMAVNTFISASKAGDGRRPRRLGRARGI